MKTKTTSHRPQGAAYPPLPLRRSFIFLIAIAVSSGCGAPLLTALSVGSGAYVGTDIYHMSTGGTAEVSFITDTASSTPDQKYLAAIKRLGVAPGIQEAPLVADALAKQGFFKIISPLTIQKALGTTPFFVDTTTMMEKERVNLYSRAAKATRADAILIMSQTGGTYDSKWWDFQRTKMLSNYALALYSVITDDLIWKQQMQLAVSFGSSMPSNEETRQVVVEAVTKRILELAGHQTTTTERQY